MLFFAFCQPKQRINIVDTKFCMFGLYSYCSIDIDKAPWIQNIP